VFSSGGFGKHLEKLMGNQGFCSTPIGKRHERVMPMNLGKRGWWTGERKEAKSCEFRSDRSMGKSAI